MSVSKRLENQFMDTVTKGWWHVAKRRAAQSQAEAVSMRLLMCWSGCVHGKEGEHVCMCAV